MASLSFGTHEVISVKSRQIRCDGGASDGNASAGHPMIYLNMGDKNFIDCPYCGRRFELDDMAEPEDHH